MRLVLYSGGYPQDNLTLDGELLQLLGSTNPRVTLIPSGFDHFEHDYQDFIDHFSPYGIGVTSVLHLDQVTSPESVRPAFDADMIFISGGNTFDILYHMRRSRLDSLIRQYAKNEGLIAGLSAGAIILTSSIATAATPHFDRDENVHKISDLRALGLLNFHFFPHYRPQRRYRRELEEFSKIYNDEPLYACPDGSGIVVNGERQTFVGDVTLFANGNLLQIK